MRVASHRGIGSRLGFHRLNNSSFLFIFILKLLLLDSLSFFHLPLGSTSAFQFAHAAYSTERGEPYDNETYVSLILNSVKRMDFHGSNQQAWPFLNLLCRNNEYLSKWHPVTQSSFREYSLMRQREQIIGASATNEGGSGSNGNPTTVPITTSPSITPTDTNITTYTTTTITTSTTTSTPMPPSTSAANTSNTSTRTIIPPLYVQSCTIYNTASNYLQVFKHIHVANASASVTANLRRSPHIAIRLASTRQAAIRYGNGFLVTVFIRGSQEARDALIASWRGEGTDSELNAYYRNTMGIRSVRILGDPAQLWGQLDLSASQWPPAGLTPDVFWSSTYDGLGDDQGLSVGWVIIIIAGMLLVVGVGAILYTRRGVGKKEVGGDLTERLSGNEEEEDEISKNGAARTTEDPYGLDAQLQSLDYDVDYHEYNNDINNNSQFSPPPEMMKSFGNFASQHGGRGGSNSSQFFDFDPEADVPEPWRLADLEAELAAGIATHARAKRIAKVIEEQRQKEEQWKRDEMQGLEEPILNHHIHRNKKKKLNEHSLLFAPSASFANNFSQQFDAGSGVQFDQYFSSTKGHISGESYGQINPDGSRSGVHTRNNVGFPRKTREEEITKPNAYQWTPQPLIESLKIDEAFRLPPLRNPDGTLVQRTSPDDDEDDDFRFSRKKKSKVGNKHRSRRIKRFGAIEFENMESGSGSGGSDGLQNNSEEFVLGDDLSAERFKYDLPPDEEIEAEVAKQLRTTELQRQAVSVFADIKDGNIGLAARRRMHEMRDVQQQIVNSVTLANKGFAPRRDNFTAFDNRTAFVNPVAVSRFAYAASVFPTWKAPLAELPEVPPTMSQPLQENGELPTAESAEPSAMASNPSISGFKPPSSSATPPQSLENTMRGSSAVQAQPPSSQAASSPQALNAQQSSSAAANSRARAVTMAPATTTTKLSNTFDNDPMSLEMPLLTESGSNTAQPSRHASNVSTAVKARAMTKIGTAPPSTTTHTQGLGARKSSIL